ncbi:MAG: hypothetical protein QNL04_11375 [SAR324 cluster bacterium]|nr:hypothetical protein [SAR324 cluster bacterium]
MDLAHFDFKFDQSKQIKGAKFQALRIHKFKEVLLKTPSLLENKTKMGVGLTALAFKYDPWSFAPYQTRLIEGEALFNFASTVGYEDFLLASAALA